MASPQRQELDAVVGEAPVDTDDGEAFTLRLGHEHAVERVGVVGRQAPGGHGVGGGDGEGPEVVRSESIQQVITARVACVPETAQTVLRIAAVLGRRFQRLSLIHI